MEDVEKNFKPINFFELRRMIDEKIVDGILMTEHPNADFIRNTVKICKLCSFEKVGVLDASNLFSSIYWLDKNKIYMPYIETHITDKCNLNCDGCDHYAALFDEDNFYPLKNFERDIRRISECADLVVLRLMGGEPLRAKNLDEYIRIARKYLPKTNIKIVTNGLLIPQAPQKILDAMRENRCVVNISVYKPTLKIMPEIEKILFENKIPLQKDTRGDEVIKIFARSLTLKSQNISPLSQTPPCGSRDCRFLRDGFLYRCHADALSFKPVEHFGIKNFSIPTGIDIHAPNFPALSDFLDMVMVERCNYCKLPGVQKEWKVLNNPTLEDYLVDPA